MAEPPHSRRDATWPPGKFAVWHQRWIDADDAQPGTVLLHHPLDPFVKTLPASTDASVWQAAHAYVVALTKLEGIGSSLKNDLPEAWIDALAPDAHDPEFGWMPLDDDDDERFTEPLGSFRVGPRDAHHAVVLFASERIGETQFRGSGFGLRIVLRMRALGSAAFEASITGLCASLPFGVYRRGRWPAAFWRQEGRLSGLLRSLFLDRVGEIARVARLSAPSVSIRGIRLAKLPGREVQIEWRGIGLPEPGEPAGAVPHAFTLLGDGAGVGVLLNRSPLVADAAAGDARVFVYDPASRGSGPVVDRRPGGDDRDLDSFRQVEVITGALDAPLADGDRLGVLPCGRFVPADASFPAGMPRPIRLDGAGPALRSDDAAAVQGFRHARDLLQRLEAYGLPVRSYFRVAKPRIELFYRSGISPGPGKDGRTVNARVLPEGWPTDMIGSKDKTLRPLLQLHLGLADLTRRAREPWVPGGPPSAATAMGIGADARWMWHEFGHVLLMATTGELELRFAHSPGDALAAIVADPGSQIEREGTRWRFVTFPWVMLPRRHDRSVLRGWSWGGAMHDGLARVPDAEHPRRKGYVSEQILSSTLFRLYRCLGGDTVQAHNPLLPNRPERRRASHYATWLVMQALQLLGDARIVPARRPDELALALMLADTLRSDIWSVKLQVGTAVPAYERVPGCAHKLVRWAFEAQGLYGAAGGDGNAPGAPPPVDVFIASGRADVDSTPYGDVWYGPGNYQPVSLHWQADAGELPLWQAREDAIQVREDGTIQVCVGNRGQVTAVDVTVAVWFTAWQTGSPAPKWSGGAGWTPCTSANSAAQNIGPGTAVCFDGFGHSPPAGRYLVLAQAGCADDRANNDPATGLACSVLPTPLVDLVAGDNNLALRVVFV